MFYSIKQHMCITFTQITGINIHRYEVNNWFHFLSGKKKKNLNPDGDHFLCQWQDTCKRN